MADVALSQAETQFFLNVVCKQIAALYQETRLADRSFANATIVTTDRAYDQVT